MPALPPGFKAKQQEQQEDSEEEMSDSETAGPRLQEQTIGPQMGGSAAREIEERAKRMKDKLEGKEVHYVLKDPDELTNLGMGAFTSIGALRPTGPRRPTTTADDGR